MAEYTRIVLDLPPPIVAVVDRLANERGITRPGLVRVAIGVLQAMQDGAKEGYLTGLTKDRDKLDTLLVGPI
jgi:hypothetical protein